MPLPEDPAERLACMRGHMQGSEVPVALLGWMKEVETQLIDLRSRLWRTEANRAESTASAMGPKG